METNKTTRTSILIFYMVTAMLLLVNFNIDAQGAKCGCTAEQRKVDADKSLVEIAQKNIKMTNEETVKAYKDLANAVYWLTLAIETEKNCNESYLYVIGALSTIKKAYDNAKIALDVAKQALYVAEATGSYWAIAAATYTVAAAEVAVSIAAALVFPAAAAVATDLALWGAAQLAIPRWQNQKDAAQKAVDAAEVESGKALAALKEANDYLSQSTTALNNCKANIKTPTACEKCVNDIIANACGPTQQCCDGSCVDIKYEYTVTITTETCTGSSTYSYTTNTQPTDCGTTGSLQMSFGTCTGGSVVTKSYSGPTLVPCQ